MSIYFCEVVPSYFSLYIHLNHIEDCLKWHFHDDSGNHPLTVCYLLLIYVFWCFLPSIIHKFYWHIEYHREELTDSKSNVLQHTIGNVGFITMKKLYLITIFRAS